MIGTISLAMGDAFDLLRAMHSESVDLVVTDPPYESLEKHRSKGTTTRLKVSKASSNEWFPIVRNSMLPVLLRELYRVLKPNSHCYLFCDGETSDILREMVRFQSEAPKKERGFTWWKRIVWDKQKIGMGYHYRSRHEFIVFLEKGKLKLNDLGIPDVLSVPRVHNGYPTEKPVPLIETLIKQSSFPGDVVLDPFFGSGSTAAAARNLDRHFIGFDIAPAAFDYAVKRLGLTVEKYESQQGASGKPAGDSKNPDTLVSDGVPAQLGA
jgi:site-specific DNA-methyltransferase (adenine-specific)